MLNNELDIAISQGLTCPYCLCASKLTNAAEVYDVATRPGDVMYACFDCRAWVGCHANTSRALGSLADDNTRRARLTAHNHFDVLWLPPKTGGYIHQSKEQSQRLRVLAYRWLSAAMGLPEELTHIGMFTEAQCLQVVDLCRRYFKIFA